jgi:hypothetical protein
MVANQSARETTAGFLAFAVVPLVVLLLVTYANLFIGAIFCTDGACSRDETFRVAPPVLAVAAVVAGVLRVVGLRVSLLALAAIGVLSAILGVAVLGSPASANQGIWLGSAGIFFFGLAVAAISLLRFAQGDPEKPAAPDAGSPPT